MVWETATYGFDVEYINGIRVQNPEDEDLVCWFSDLQFPDRK